MFKPLISRKKRGGATAFAAMLTLAGISDARAESCPHTSNPIYVTITAPLELAAWNPGPEIAAGTYEFTRNQSGYYHPPDGSMEYSTGGGGGTIYLCGQFDNCWDSGPFLSANVWATTFVDLQATSHPNVFVSCTAAATVPELEDYAAAAFILLALTIGWHVRRRYLPVS